MRFSVPNCFNYYDMKRGEISFFGLPRDSELRNAWINALPKSARGLSARSKICSAHFSERDMNICMGRRRLAKNAVPCLFGYQVSDPATNAVINYDSQMPSSSSQISGVEELELDSRTESQFQCFVGNLEECVTTQLQDHSSFVNIHKTIDSAVHPQMESQFLECMETLEDCAIQELQAPSTSVHIAGVKEKYSYEASLVAQVYNNRE